MLNITRIVRNEGDGSGRWISRPHSTVCIHQGNAVVSSALGFTEYSVTKLYFYFSLSLPSLIVLFNNNEDNEEKELGGKKGEKKRKRRKRGTWVA